MIKDDTELHEFLNDVRVWVAKGKYDFEHCATRTDPMGPYWKQDLVAAALATSCNLGKMAKLLGRPRRGVKSYIERTPDVAEFFDDEFETYMDLVEDNMLQAAREGDLSAARFVLQTRGKDRGFTTRVETTGKDGGPVETISASPKEKLNALLDRISPKTNTPDLEVLEGGKK